MSNIAPELKERTPVDDLRQHPDNYNEGVVEQIAASLEYHGMVRPILVSVGTPGLEDGTIIAGNHTWLAAKSLGWEEVATTYRKFPSEQDAVAYLIADNETARAAEGNREELGKLLEPLTDSMEADQAGMLGAVGMKEEDFHDVLDELEFTTESEGRGGSQYAETDEEREARDKSREYEETQKEPMVEAMLVLTKTEHGEFVERVDALKKAWDLTSAKLVIMRAIKDAYELEELHETESAGAV